MKKQTKVLVAAAMLTLGASFTSMAATYDWKLVDGEWMCYDEDGVEYTDTFCKYEGDEFYVNEDGVLEGHRWVDDTYFVDIYGRKARNEWVYTITDDNEEENWYYFGAKGTLATNDKITWEGNTYFVGEDGGLLTGWVEYTKANKGENGAEDVEESARAIEEDETFDWAKTYYTDENGTLVTTTWINVAAPASADDEDTTYDYYVNKYGRPVKGKQTIGGLTYFFGTDRTMLSGWVGKTDGNYVETWGDGNDYSTEDFANFDEVYFCGDASQGYAKKDRWIELESNSTYGQDAEDPDTFWYLFRDNGKLYMPKSVDSAAAYELETDEDTDVTTIVEDTDSDLVALYNYKVGSDYYAFNANGQMQSGLIKMNNKMYYYGDSSDGAKKNGAQTIDDIKFFFATEDSTANHYYEDAGVNGYYKGYVYADGMIQVAEDDKYEKKTVTIDGTEYTFIVNSKGKAQLSDDVYEDGDEKLFGGATFTYDEDSKKSATYGSIK